MKGIKVLTGESVWRAQLEESMRLLRELEAVKTGLGKDLEQVGGGRGCCTARLSYLCLQRSLHVPRPL